MSNPKVTMVEDLLACMHRMKELRNEFIKSGGCDMFVCSTDAWNTIRNHVVQSTNPPPNIARVGHFGGIPVLIADTQKEVLAIMVQAILDGKRVKLVGWDLTYDPLNGLDEFFSSTPN